LTIKYREEDYNPPPGLTVQEYQKAYEAWKLQFDILPPRPIESRRNSQWFKELLEGSSTSQNWRGALSGVSDTQGPQDTTVTMTPRLYDLLKKEGHMGVLLDNKIKIRRESWPQYALRLLSHITRIGQPPK